MAEKAWNEGQRQALDASGLNVLVSAAAGSGKTAVLTERVLSHVRDGECDLRDILVVTFSSAAAAEMKERIYDRLVNTAATHGSRCIRQSELIGEADICTIHSLCARIIRENFEQAGIAPGYYTLPAGEAELIREEACREVFDELYENGDESFLGLVRRYCGRSDLALRDMVLKLHNFITSQVDGRQWMENMLSMQETSAYLAELSARYDGQNLLALKESLDTGVALQVALQKRGYDRMAAAVAEDCYRIREIKIVYEEKGREAFLEFAMGASIFSRASFAGMDKGFADFIRDAREEMKNLVKDILKDDYLSGFESKTALEIAHTAPDAKELLRLYGMFAQRFSEMKKERNALDFNDLEHKALSALADAEVCKKYTGKYRHIYVDEYQDTNPVQEEIIRRLSRADNRFMVGDLKQSIYRFRQADPMIFRDKARLYAMDDTQGSLIRMNENFRSFKEIIDFVNYIMGSLMSESLGDIDYRGGESLSCGKKMEGGGISMLLSCLPGGEEEGEDIGGDARELDEAEFEAHTIAQEIKRLFLQPVYDDRQGGYRNAGYGDFAILLREVKKTGKVFKAALQAHGIPAFVETDAALSDYPEVEAFIHLLKIIDNFRQDIPLLTVMRSGFGSFSPEELADIRIFKNDDQPFYAAVRAYAEQKDDALAYKLQSFIQKIQRLKRMSKGMRMSEFLLTAEKETGFGEKLSALINGEGKYASLTSLLENAGQAGQSASESLHLFIRYIDEMQRLDRLSEMIKPQGGRDTVKILSIHKSKGLEFPVVIMPRLNKRFNMRDQKEDLLICRDLGPALPYIDEEKFIKREPLLKRQAKNNTKRETLSEELRILYVGLTRAKQRLVLSGSVPDISKSMLKWLKPRTQSTLLRRGSYLDWLMPFVLELKSAQPLYDKANPGFDARTWDEPSVEIKIVSCVDEVNIENGARQQMVDEYFNSIDTAPLDALSYSYPFAGDLFVPSKRSVTQIKKDDTEDFVLLPAVEDTPEEESPRINAAKRGTVTHYAMRYLALSRGLEIDGALSGLVERKLLSDEEAEEVNRDWIRAFCESDIAARLNKAEKIFREMPFCLSVPAANLGFEGSGESVVVQGVIDLFFMEQGAWVILDYKTDRVNAKTAPDAAKKYQKQLDLYEQALVQITNIPVKEKLVYFFRGGLVRL
jgi:ATP-dependent helicase/nuclease subunit A